MDMVRTNHLNLKACLSLHIVRKRIGLLVRNASLFSCELSKAASAGISFREGLEYLEAMSSPKNTSSSEMDDIVFPPLTGVKNGTVVLRRL